MNSFHIVTLVPGDGIGPEIAASLVTVFKAIDAPVTWDVFASPQDRPKTFAAILESARNHKLLVKGPLTTEVGRGCTSRNVVLRTVLELFANVRPFKSFDGVESRWDGVDLLLVRENTEGAYSGIEHDDGLGKIGAVKVVTKKASLRIAEYAFAAASRRPRRDLTVGHKANIMKKSDGLFLQCCREVSKKYPEVSYHEMLVDNCCMQLVMNPRQFDVLLFQNLYGDIASDLCAGLIGGLGLAPSANLGPECAMFEAVHGSAPDIAGKGIANPTALLLSGALLLRHLKLEEKAARLERAIRSVIEAGDFTTRDLGGSATTATFTQAVIRAYGEPAKESVWASSSLGKAISPLART